MVTLLILAVVAMTIAQAVKLGNKINLENK